MSPRPPSRPPELPGYEYQTLLGSGGFADVFLYRQERPQREVAIKVLLADVHDPAVRRQFESEANVMATLSTHPSIVTIHQADVSADGRPYIAMEFCSRPNYGVRFRSERIAVDEALRVGVQIAGAVETAHRAGILHRDIKPANILVTAYNRPALTDFGISIAAGEGDLDDSVGMSVPWSPPECFADPPRADVRSDVFSLAASVYSLLAGRSPFEPIGTRASAADLIRSIETVPLAPLDRPDVPPSLNRVLAVAMAKDPAGRYDSALSLGRALQSVESELSLPVTGMDVLEERGAAAEPHPADDELDAHTRIRSITTLPAPGASSPNGPGRVRDPFAAVAPAPGAVPGPRRSARTVPETTAPTVLRPASAASPTPVEPEDPAGADRPGPRRGRVPAWAVLTLVTVLVLVLGVGAVVAVRTLFPVEAPAVASRTTAPVLIGSADVPVPEGVTIEPIDMGPGIDKARITWQRPEGFDASDSYTVHWDIDVDGYEKYAQPVTVTGREAVVLDMPPHQDQVCVEVAVVPSSGAIGEPAEQCASP